MQDLILANSVIHVDSQQTTQVGKLTPKPAGRKGPTERLTDGKRKMALLCMSGNPTLFGESLLVAPAVENLLFHRRYSIDMQMLETLSSK